MLVKLLRPAIVPAQYLPLVRIVPGAFLGVGEDFVGDLDFCEEFGGALDVAIVAVGVQLESLSAVRLLDPRMLSVWGII